jgi:chromatin modification-related protein EAF6
MTDNPPPTTNPTGSASAAGSAAGNAAAGLPYYEKQRQHLKEMIARKRALEKRLVSSNRMAVLASTRLLMAEMKTASARRSNLPKRDRLPRKHA